MSELKYIVIRDRDDEERVILFDRKIVHRDVARIHSATGGPWVISAGFCTLSPVVKAYGSSESLRGLSSRTQDADIIAKAFGLLAAV